MVNVQEPEDEDPVDPPDEGPPDEGPLSAEVEALDSLELEFVLAPAALPLLLSLDDFFA
jgi:hypothetical protein